MSKSELTAVEAFQSLNYFEIEALKKKWGVALKDIEEMAVEALYGVIAITEARKSGGLDMNAVKNLSVKDAQDWFADEDPDPDSDQGKGSTATE